MLVIHQAGYQAQLEKERHRNKTRKPNRKKSCFKEGGTLSRKCLTQDSENQEEAAVPTILPSTNMTVLNVEHRRQKEVWASIKPADAGTREAGKGKQMYVQQTGLSWGQIVKTALVQHKGLLWMAYAPGGVLDLHKQVMQLEFPVFCHFKIVPKGVLNPEYHKS